MEDESPKSVKFLLPLIMLGAFGIALTAVWLSITFDNPLQALFSERVAANGILWGLAGAVAAWALRRIIAGPMPRGEKLKIGRWMVAWVTSRLALLVSAVALGVCLLLALLFGLSLWQSLLQALLLVVVAAAFVGIAGGAAINLC